MRYLVAVVLVVTLAPATSAAFTKICAKFCDGAPAHLATEPHVGTSFDTSKRRVSVMVSDADNVAFAKLEFGTPGDELWLDRSWDDGQSTHDGGLIGFSVIPAESTEVSSGLFNIDGSVPDGQIGVFRACAKVQERVHILCSKWTRSTISKPALPSNQPATTDEPICHKHCDGAAWATAHHPREAAFVETSSRRFSIFISDADNVAFGKIANGVPGEDVWLDRSWDGGKNWQGRLGLVQITEASTEVSTNLFNIDGRETISQFGFVRACGTGNKRIVCTAWTRSHIAGRRPVSPVSRICLKFCDGATAHHARSQRIASSADALGRRISVRIADNENVACGRIENGQPGDEVWLDRSWVGGKSWAFGARLSNSVIKERAHQVTTDLINIDGSLRDWEIGTLRACANILNEGIVCTPWTSPQLPAGIRATNWTVCAKYCDDATEPVPDSQIAAETVLEKLKISLVVSEKNNVAFGQIEGGVAGNEIWLDRSWTCGKNREGSRMGITSIPAEENTAKTSLFNVDGDITQRQIGMVRACGASAALIRCTEWKRARQELTLQCGKICNELCDGDAKDLANNYRLAASQTLYARKISIHIADASQVAFAQITFGVPKDEVWIDRSWNGGIGWGDGSRLGFSSIPQGADEVSTSVFNTDGKPNDRLTGSVRACGKVFDRDQIACTPWTQPLRLASGARFSLKNG